MADLDLLQIMFGNRRSIWELFRDYKPAGLPSDGDNYPVDLLLGPMTPLPGWTVDASGLIHPYFTEKYSSDINDKLENLRRQLEGFYGEDADKNPGAIYAATKHFVADGGGNIAAADVVSTPGSGYRTRVLAIRVKTGATAAGGVIHIQDEAGTPNAGFVFQNDACSDSLVLPMNWLLPEDDAVQIATAAVITAADDVCVSISSRTEDA